MFIDESEFITVLDEVLESIFGQMARDLLYAYLLQRYDLSKDQIFKNPALFIDALLSVFGISGAMAVETEILRAIERRNSKDQDENRLKLTQVNEYASKLLEHINFMTEYDAKLYIALLSYGETIANKLSKVSGVPRTRVYGCVKRLREMEVISTRRFKGKTFFRPKNPEKIFREHIELLRKKLMSFEQILNELNTLYNNLSLPEELNSLEQLNSIKDSLKKSQQGNHH